MTSLALRNPSGQPQAMSTREIAELTGSTHDNVLKTVRRLVTEGVVSANETPYQHPQNGQTYMEFRLSFRDTMVVVSGYSAELRARIIDRWQELEAGAAPAALNLRDPRQLSAVAVQLLEVNQELQAQIAAAAPKVAFADAVGAAENDQSIEEVAKALGMGRNRLFAFLREQGVLMPKNLPYQQHIERRRFRVAEVPVEQKDGTKLVFPQTRVTGKGVTYIQQLLARARATAPPHQVVEARDRANGPSLLEDPRPTVQSK